MRFMCSVELLPPVDVLRTMPTRTLRHISLADYAILEASLASMRLQHFPWRASTLDMVCETMARSAAEAYRIARVLGED